MGVYEKMEGENKIAVADLGGSVVTGILGNQLGLLARHLSYTIHTMLDKASKVKQNLYPIIYLGEALETLRKDFSVAMNNEDMSFFDWHLANLEYANAGLL
uniref:Uncharacterized protein n=1 Tax=Solanum lycopersicum TaxID=4081 RepID=K4BZP7_SOLLC